MPRVSHLSQRDGASARTIALALALLVGLGAVSIASPGWAQTQKVVVTNSGTGLGDDSVTIFNLADGSLFATVDAAGKSPTGVAICGPHGRFAGVTNVNSESVTWIDVTTGLVVATTTVGPSQVPGDIACTSDAPLKAVITVLDDTPGREALPTYVCILDVSVLPAPPGPCSNVNIGVDTFVEGLAVTPDGKFAAALLRDPSALAYVDIPGSTFLGLTALNFGLVSGVAIGPAHTAVAGLALVTIQTGETPLVVVNISGLPVVPSGADVVPSGADLESNGLFRRGVTITADGSLAAIAEERCSAPAGCSGAGVGVYDIPGFARRVCPSPPIGFALGVATTPVRTSFCPSGFVAVVADGGNSVSVVCLQPGTPACVTKAFSPVQVGRHPTSIAITPVSAPTVISPNGGECWPIGATRNISWAAGGGNVRIELSRTGGSAPWAVITGNTPNDGSYSWVVTGPPTTQARIRITSLTDPTVSDTSDGNVTIGCGHITVTSPNGGEVWGIGTTHNVTWNSTNLSGNVKIEVSRTGGTPPWTVITANTPNDGSYSWAVPGPATTQARIRITSLVEPGVSDTSDANFTISSPPVPTVLSPNGGECWPIGATRNITWVGGSGNVRIELSRTGGSAPWALISNNTPNDGSYTWVVTGPPTTQARIRITSLTDPTVSDTSDGNFTIGCGYITVISPNGGEVWGIGTTHNVTWNSTNLSGNVKIEVSRTGGTLPWTVITANTPNDGSYSWAVPGPATTQARIRITSLVEPGVSDTSDANFTISSPPVPTVLSPNG